MYRITLLIAATAIFSGCVTSDIAGSTADKTRQAELLSDKMNLLCNPEIESAITFHSGMLKSLTSYDKLEGIAVGSHLGAQLETARDVLRRGSLQEKCIVAVSELKRKIFMAERLIDKRKAIPDASVDAPKVEKQIGEMKVKLKTISKELDILRSNKT